MLLNGSPLVLEEREVPVLVPRVVEVARLLLPPHHIGFWVIPGEN